jgi:hypothetical protein
MQGPTSNPNCWKQLASRVLRARGGGGAEKALAELAIATLLYSKLYFPFFLYFLPEKVSAVTRSFSAKSGQSKVQLADSRVEIFKEKPFARVSQLGR